MTPLGIGLYSSTVILALLAVIVTALRFYTRLIIIKGFGADDHFMSISLFFYIIYIGCVFWAIAYTKGGHINEVSTMAYTPALKAFYFGELFFVITACFTKLSIGTFFLRIVQAKKHVYTIYTTFCVVVCSSLVFVFLVIFQCSPVAHYWHQFNPLAKGTCFKATTIVAASSTYGVILALSDFIFATIPIFMVWQLQMNIRVKISVGTLMSLGAVAGVAAIVRILFLKNIAGGSDFFYNSGLLTNFTTLELSLGLIVGSTATLRPLFRRILGEGSSFGTSSRSHAGQTHTPGRHGSRAWETYLNHGEDRISGEESGAVELGRVRVEGGATRFSKGYGRPKKTTFRNDSQEELTASHGTTVLKDGGILKMTSVEMTEELAVKSIASSISKDS